MVGSVRAYDGDSGEFRWSNAVFGTGFTGGVRVAAGDVTGDGRPDAIAASGAGYESWIEILDGVTGEPVDGSLSRFRAFSLGCTQGVYVAAGDVDGDGRQDVIAATIASTGPRIKAFSGLDGSILTNFRVRGEAFSAGISIAAADFDDDGAVEVVVGGSGGRVRVYEPLTGELASNGLGERFLRPFGSDYTGPVYVGTDELAGDVDGDGVPDLAVGTGSGSIARVKVFSGADGGLVHSLRPFGSDFEGGVRVALAYVDDDTFADVVVGSGPGIPSRVKVFGGATGTRLEDPLGRYLPFGEDFAGGIFVAASNDPDTVSISATFNGNYFAALVEAQLFTVEISVVGPYVPPTGLVSVTATDQLNFATYDLGDAILVPVGSSASLAVLSGIAMRAGDYELTVYYPGDDDHISGWFTTLLVVNGASGPAPLAPVEVCPPGLLHEPSGISAASSSTSSNGVSYATGVMTLTRTDLASTSLGDSWGANWTWTSADGYGDGTSGTGASLVEFAHLVQVNDDDSIALIEGGSSALFFDYFGGAYRARYGSAATLVHDTINGVFVATDGTGRVLRFYDFSGTTPSGRAGNLISTTDVDGQLTEVISWNGLGNATEVQRATGVGASLWVESFVYSYIGAGTNAGLLSSVLQRTKQGAGSWQTVRSVEYTYHDGTTSAGTARAMRTATVKDGSGAAIDTAYYRYYTSGTGSVGKIKYAFGTAAYAEMVGDLGSSIDSLTDGQVDDYASAYLQYDSLGRVTTLVAAAEGCSACAGGQGTFTYSYTSNSILGPIDTNSWVSKTIETLPSGSTRTIYANANGQSMLEVFSDGSNSWREYTRYDSAGRILLQAGPTTVTGLNESLADLVGFSAGNATYLNDSVGLVAVYSYGISTTATSSTTGDVVGYIKQIDLKQGETGTAIPQQSLTYFTRTAGGLDFTHIASATVYSNDNGTGDRTTNYAYTFYSGTNQIESVTTTLPTVTTAQNGSNTAATATTVMDQWGRAIWTKDADGFLNYTQYDPGTGAVVKFIQDVNTSLTGTFADLPGGWSTPGGGGLHLTSTYEVDDLGRTTKSVDPKGNVTYTVYDDTNLEVRVYRGWNGSTNAPTGPIEVYREDRAGRYSESLTMSATPTVSSGRPTGAEAIGSIQSLSRTYSNEAGQAVYTDAYFDLSGVTYSTAANIGTLNANFYRTTQDYDHQGRANRSVSAAGTIYRTVYDGLGRAVSEWVGTDDTPTTGFWSPTNLAGTNMVKVREYEYDGGGVGNSNLTKVTEFPGLGADPRVTQTWYDWRDRAVASKAGVQVSESTDVNRPLSYREYNNLGEVMSSELYDGDGVTLTTTNGVPDRPSASLLRSKSTAEYDAWGRAFRSTFWSVDPSTGAVSSTGLVSQSWFDSRGNTVKSSSPGGLVSKSQYDGVGRTTVSSVTDGGGDTTYADAFTVTGDIVLSQMEYTYDANSNVILTTSRDRFHTATGTGALGTPSSGINARVYYNATYYDKADRTTDTVNVGTNGGTVYTRPGTVPSRSDNELVTSYGYDSAGRLEFVTDPRGLVSRTVYDLMGRTTQSIENYVDGVVSDADDKTTVYAYGPAGMVSLTSLVTGGGGQTTEYVYGVSTGIGSAITSNDIVGATKWPDATTGLASSSEQETTTVNALGQTLTATDRNGNVHTLSYDVLGRLVSDAVTTLGAGVNDNVRRVEYGYDGQGNQFLVTSYDAPTGGSIVNQVKRDFNGLGQLTAIWQSHSGAVTGTTPKVGYTYSEMAGGANHSRMTGMTYPSGYQVSVNYASGLDSNISRLTSFLDSTGTLVDYSYLGLGTVVIENRPQPDFSLSHVLRIPEALGDAGDIYTGLDRFGRISQTRWLSGAGSILDWESYTHDRSSNRLTATNHLNAAFNEAYGYDNLNQLTSFDRGSGARTQAWEYDSQGNFEGVTTDGTTETRTHNRQNEITGVGSSSLTFDANGNMTTDETGRQFVYDAWNRLVEVKDSGGATLKTFGYDGQGWRVTETAVGVTRDFYFTANWQVAEETVGGLLNARYVWGNGYVDEMVYRQRDTNGDGILDERLWPTHDANFNITTLVDDLGNVAERYAYDSYGVRTVMDAAWNVLGASAYGFTHGFQGLRFDAVAGLSDTRNRWYSPTLGRFMTNDPIRYEAGDVNLYRARANNPVVFLDPSGELIWLIPVAGAAAACYFLSGCSKPPAPAALPTNGEAPINGGTLKWNLTRHPKDRQTLEMNIEFIPDRESCKCKNIGLIQVVIRSTINGEPLLPEGSPDFFKKITTDKGAKVDLGTDKDRDPYYNANWDDKAKKWVSERNCSLGSCTPPTNATMVDRPNAGGSGAIRSFEAMVVCIDTGKVLGGIRYGATNGVIVGGTKNDVGGPSAEWASAVAQWNKFADANGRRSFK